MKCVCSVYFPFFHRLQTLSTGRVVFSLCWGKQFDNSRDVTQATLHHLCGSSVCSYFELNAAALNWKEMVFRGELQMIDQCLNANTANMFIFHATASCTSLLRSSVLYKICVASTLHNGSHFCGQKACSWCCWVHSLMRGESAWPNYPIAPSLRRCAV